jgi:nucleoside-diphosphate-sugar epimerase
MWLTNVHGSRRVFRAVVDAGVPSLVYASSVGAYSAGPKDRRVDESWPTDGIQTNTYARHKATVERELDLLERTRPELRVVRLRPAFVFKREAGSGVRRLFLGPFVPNPVVRPALIPLVPEHPRFRFQAVHSYDLGDAYRLAIVGDARGAFNIAADPVLDGERLGRLLDARPVRVGHRALRGFVEATWRLRLQPVEGSWVDLAYGVPLMDAGRASRELGWEPKRSSEDAFLDLLGGIRDSAGLETPPLTPKSNRLEEVATGVGGSESL